VLAVTLPETKKKNLNYAAVASQRLIRMPVFQFLIPLPWFEAVNLTINAQVDSNQAPKPV
jgi:hypothetical protein